MTREDLINKIRVKMDVEPSSTEDDYYTNYYNSLIDECLSIVANTVLPYQKKIQVKYGGILDGEEIEGETRPIVNEKDLVKGYYYKASRKLYVKSDKDIYLIVALGDYVYYSDDESTWDVCPRNNFGYMIKIPDDLMSFSHESLISFKNERGEIELDPKILYINSKTLALPKDGDYEI